ncbi:hypothetical protein [Micromonospora aurantiaca (nom. illeg.)]|uniref:hypothetical protein n=1 Tax=Micromonospora aurantiaca (nom. illeg.) TaxID=47850 RepID=UPI00056C3DFE|nr:MULTISPECIES: hypothetical protein [Micromonospora]MBC9003008.1 hypothetical protein [Micromonospora aurantiaca]
MNTATKLSGFALGLAAVFGTAYGVGHLTGPVASQTRHEAPNAGHTDGGMGVSPAPAATIAPTPDAGHGSPGHGHS